MEGTQQQQAQPPTIRRIVVGVDGSDGATHALAFAIAEAERWDADLEVVAAWEYPWQWTEGYNPRWAEDEDWFAKHAEEQATELVERVLGGRDGPPAMRVVTVRGPAVQVLVEAAADADLLVVGSRGRGGFRGMLLGSVSNGCVHHAPCPVTVVPATA